MAAGETGVFVLGMHRSGTSATTRAINLLGVPVASDEELKPASPNNPTGFWEVTRLTDFNNRLLAELGGSSLAPPPLEPGWARRADLERRRKRARRLFSKVHPTHAWVWKDPRNCVLLPFWSEALEARPVVVFVHRDPAEVARSLAARQGLSAAMSFAAWERYVRSALAAMEGRPAYVTSYSDLVGEPAAWAAGVGGFLRDQGLPADPDGGAAAVAELVCARTRRDAAPDSAEPAAAGAEGPPFEPSAEQRELVAALESLAGEHEHLPLPGLAPETPWVEPLLAERRRADTIRQQMEERLRATRRRLRAVQSGEGQAEELPKQGARGGGRVGSLDRLRRRVRTGASKPSGARGGMPDYLIIGAQKCGTSSLFRYLGESPHVGLPTEKEIHFFDNQFERGVDWYRSHFPAAGRRGRTITGEASPYYVFHPLAAERIRETLPDVRLILLLRNPVHRAVSHYYHELGNGFEELPLAAALDQEEERLAGEEERIVADPGYSSFNHRHFSYQARGAYADQLERWRAIFPPDQLLVINSDRLFERPVREVQRAYEFLGVPGRPPRDLGAYNQRDYPAIPVEVEERLADHFADLNARLYELVGEDFGWAA